MRSLQIECFEDHPANLGPLRQTRISWKAFSSTLVVDLGSPSFSGGTVCLHAANYRQAQRMIEQTRPDPDDSANGCHVVFMLRQGANPSHKRVRNCSSNISHISERVARKPRAYLHNRNIHTLFGWTAEVARLRQRSKVLEPLVTASIWKAAKAS